MRKLLNFLKDALAAIGALSSIVTVLWALFSPFLQPLVSKCPWGYLIFLIVVSLVYAGIKNRPKNKIKLRLSDKVNVQVLYGDLFESDGIIVIPVNEYFDTIVDNKIISSNTVHGKFVKQFFGGDEANLKKQIKNALSREEPVEVNSKRVVGNQKKYPLGTVCEVHKNDKKFFLVALTRFNDNHRAEVKNSEYQRVLCDLWTFVEQKSQGTKVSIPLMGAGHSGVNLSKQKLLEFLLFSIALKDDMTLINGVDVVLHKSVKCDVDLSSTETLFKTIRI